MGAALRAARRAAGVRRRDAAGRGGLKTAALRNYERGAEPCPTTSPAVWPMPTTAMLSTLLPNRDVAPVILEPGLPPRRAASKTLRSDDPHPDEVLKGYLSLLYDMREHEARDPDPAPRPDLDALAEALGGTSDAIEARLIELMHVTRDEAAAMTATLLRRRFVVPAAGIIFGAGLLTGAVKLTDEHGSKAQHHADVDRRARVGLQGRRDARNRGHRRTRRRPRDHRRHADQGDAGERDAVSRSCSSVR